MRSNIHHYSRWIRTKPKQNTPIVQVRHLIGTVIDIETEGGLSCRMAHLCLFAQCIQFKVPRNTLEGIKQGTNDWIHFLQQNKNV